MSQHRLVLEHGDIQQAHADMLRICTRFMLEIGYTKRRTIFSTPKHPIHNKSKLLRLCNGTPRTKYNTVLQQIRRFVEKLPSRILK